MTREDRIEEIIGLLKAAWLKNPELRLCQLLENKLYAAGFTNTDKFYVSDLTVAEALK